MVNDEISVIFFQHMFDERTLVVHFKGRKLKIPRVQLDTYQLLDLYRDSKMTIETAELKPPTNCSFTYCPPIKPKQRFPLKFDSDWLKLSEKWEGITGDVEIYLIETKEPSEIQKIVQMLSEQAAKGHDSQVCIIESDLTNDEEVVVNESVNGDENRGKNNLDNDLENPRDEDDIIDDIISSIPENTFANPTHSQASHWADTLIVTPAVHDLSQPSSSTQPPSFIDVDIGLRGLEAYDLRSLSQPHRYIDDDMDFGEVSIDGNGDEYEAENEDAESDDTESEENSEEGDSEDEDFVDTDGDDDESEVSLDDEDPLEPMDENDYSEVLEVYPASYDNLNPLNVPQFIQDEEGFQERNPQYLIYSNGEMWARSTDGSITLTVGDIFIEKQQYAQVLKDYAVQEGFSLSKIKNDKTRHTMRCKGQGCSWRIHCSLLPDKCSWQIKTLTGNHVCQRLETNLMASKRWVARLQGQPYHHCEGYARYTPGEAWSFCRALYCEKS